MKNESERRLLFLVMTANATSSPLNEHVLARSNTDDVAVCSFFNPSVDIPESVAVFSGSGSFAKYRAAIRRATDNSPNGYEIVHAHAPVPACIWLVNWFFDRSTRRHNALKRFVYTVHSSINLYPWRIKLLLIPIFALSGKVIFCSKASQNSCPSWLNLLLGKRGIVIRNGVNLERISDSTQTPNVDKKAESGTFRLAWIGRFIPLKRPNDAVSAVAKAGDTCHLTMIGAGHLSDQVGALSKNLNISDCVRLTGLIPREQVYVELEKSDCLIATSTGEGMPISVLEAMIAGCSVVLSDIPSHREIAESCDHVRLFPVGDIESLANHLQELAKTPKSVQQANIQTDRRTLERDYSLTGMLRDYSHAYATILKEHSIDGRCQKVKAE